jgi:hypothetical protein
MHEREVSGQKHFFLFGISPLYRKEIFRVWGGGKNFAFKRRLFFFEKTVNYAENASFLLDLQMPAEGLLKTVGSSSRCP